MLAVLLLINQHLKKSCSHVDGAGEEGFPVKGVVVCMSMTPIGSHVGMLDPPLVKLFGKV